MAAVADPNCAAPEAGGHVESDGAAKLQKRENIELVTGNRGKECIQTEEGEEDRGAQCIMGGPLAV